MSAVTVIRMVFQRHQGCAKSSLNFIGSRSRLLSPTRSFRAQSSTFGSFSNSNRRRSGESDEKAKKQMFGCMQFTDPSRSFSSSSADEKPKRKPLLNRLLSVFRVGPKVHYILEKSGAVVDPSLLNLISTSVALGVYAFAATTGCSYFNIDTTPFVGLFGAGGAALGFGMKDIANNYVCGILMAVQSNFKRGDEVTVAGSYTGTVQKMSLRHLELECVIDNQEKKLVFVPNSDVFAKAIIVHRKMPASAPDAMETEEELEKATS